MKPTYSDDENTMTYDGKTYEAVVMPLTQKYFPCSSCAFGDFDDCDPFKCEPEERKDGNSVLWKRVK